jgi:hypothetical protein
MIKTAITVALFFLAVLAFPVMAQETVVSEQAPDVTTDTVRTVEMPPEPAPPPVENPDAIKPPDELVPQDPSDGVLENIANRPPLGIGDLIVHLDSAVGFLNDNPTSIVLRQDDSPMNRHLNYIEDYLQHALQTRYSDLEYAWHSMGRDFIYPKPAQYQAFDENKIFRGITALRFSANSRQGKVYVSQVRVFGEDKNDVRYYPFNKWIVPDLPRYQYLYLGEPMDVRRIEVMSFHDGDGKRRLYLDAGNSSRPDYPREAIYHIQRARNFIENGRLEQFKIELSETRQAINALYHVESKLLEDASGMQ